MLLQTMLKEIIPADETACRARFYSRAKPLGNPGALETSLARVAAIAAMLPLGTTVGIRRNGFMDTVDALAPHQPRERKLEITKDSRCGAFTALWRTAFSMANFCLRPALYGMAAMQIAYVGFILSRPLAVLCTLNLSNARYGGMLFAFTECVQKRIVLAVMRIAGLLCAAVMLMRPPVSGAPGDTAGGGWLQACVLATPAGAWIGARL